MKIALGSDHGGFQLKQLVIPLLRKLGHTIQDFGCYSDESTDYPDYAVQVAEKVANGDFDRGILICGSGQGMCVTANKVPGIRAALCNELASASLSRAHNNSNVLCMGARIIDPDLAFQIVTTWLATDFEGGRHDRRVQKIADIEKRFCR
jgi:ribose 5-phosphate isomerase B